MAKITKEQYFEQYKIACRSHWGSDEPFNDFITHFDITKCGSDCDCRSCDGWRWEQDHDKLAAKVAKQWEEGWKDIKPRKRIESSELDNLRLTVEVPK